MGLVSTLLEVFGEILFYFTRSVTEHYNPEEPEFTTESFGYDPLQSTGREWYYHSVDELIYQEYGDSQVTSSTFMASRSVHARLINACLPEEIYETETVEDRAMAWKRLRPSFLQTAYKSLCIGAWISFLTAVIIGILFLLITYLCFKTTLDCVFYSRKSIPTRVQWMRTISDAISVVFYYLWIFVNLLFLFRPYQLKGLKRKLLLVCFVAYCLDISYRVSLQFLSTPYYLAPSKQIQIPMNIIFLVSICLQLYLVNKIFSMGSTRNLLSRTCKMIVPICLPFVFGMFICDYLYPFYIKRDVEGKLAIALFSPLILVVVKTISRICVQRLWNITHPGYSYVLLAPLYLGSAMAFRVLQADIDNLLYMAVLGIVHGAAEVVERSVMVVIDHCGHMLWKRESSPWGSFRTPRRERLMADIAIMGMLYESTAIVSMNGLIYLSQFAFIANSSLLELVRSFAICTSVQLVIEWFFTGMSLAIETRYQNLAVMAVWRRRWKRHILVAIVNIVPIAVWNSSCLLVLIGARFSPSVDKPCKIPFA